MIDRIVDVNLTSDNKILLKVNKMVKFTYEVNWKESNIEFDKRFDKYLDPTFFQHRVIFKIIFVMLVFKGFFFSI